MRQKNSSAGYTVLELYVVIMIIFIVICIVAVPVTVCKSNVWFSKDGVAKQLKTERPAITKVVKIERNVFAYSVITALKGDTKVKICLDTDVLFNYEFVDCD